jgi:hypothetical protein
LPKYWKARRDARLLAPGTSAAAFTSATTATGTATTATLAWNHRTGFIHYQRATQEIAAVASFDRTIRSSVVVDFDEPESASLTGKTIAHYIHAVNGNTSLREEIR